MAQYEISKSNEEEEALLLLEEHSYLKYAIASLKKRDDFETGHFIIEKIEKCWIGKYTKFTLEEKLDYKYNLVASSHLGKIKMY